LVLLNKNIIKSNKFKIKLFLLNIKIIKYFNYGHKVELYHDKILDLINILTERANFVHYNNLINKYNRFPFKYIKILFHLVCGT